MKKYGLLIRGKTREWLFIIAATPDKVADWREDGLSVEEVVGSVPQIIITLGLRDIWLKLQEWGIIPI
jgi:hypothetical protein